MATAKKNQKTTPKEAPKFEIVNSMKEAVDKYAARLKEYDNKYVNKVLETGKEINAKYVAKAVETGKEWNEKYLKEFNEKYFAKAIESGKGFAEERYGQVSDIVDKVKVKGCDFSRDAKDTFEGLVEVGRNFVETLPVKEMVEKKVSEGLKSVSGKITSNLPTREDIAKLSSAMDILNKKVDALSKKLAA